MSDWPLVALADLSAKPQYGAIAKGEESPVGPRFVRQTDIVTGAIDWGVVPYCDLPSKDFEKYRLSPGDLLISRLGNGVGNAATVKDVPEGAVFAGYLVRFQVTPDLADANFVGYQLQSDKWRSHVSSFRSGAAQPTLNAQQMGAFEFPLPPLEEQRGIAATLGALDDKIDSNRRVIEQVRELTMALYRAPGERRKVTASTLLKPVLGGTPKRSVPEYWDGPIPWASAKDIAASDGTYVLETEERITELGVEKSAAKVLPEFTVVMTARGTVGALALLPHAMAFNQSCYALTPLGGVSPHVLFLGLQDAVQRIQDSGHGSVFNTVNMATFDQIELDWPALESTQVREIEQLSQLALQRLKETQKLEALRDALLPDLLSGRIRVPEAAEAVAQA